MSRAKSFSGELNWVEFPRSFHEQREMKAHLSRLTLYNVKLADVKQIVTGMHITPFT